MLVTELINTNGMGGSIVAEGPDRLRGHPDSLDEAGSLDVAATVSTAPCRSLPLCCTRCARIVFGRALKVSFTNLLL